MQKILHNLEDTKKLAKELVDLLKPGQVVAFYGDLGSGKTTLIQMIAKELGVKTPVTSPTFVIQKNYPLKDNNILIHIDCYRLSSPRDAEDLGFLDLFEDKNAIVLIEWAERIEELLPKGTIHIRLTEVDNNDRKVLIEN